MAEKKSSAIFGIIIIVAGLGLAVYFLTNQEGGSAYKSKLVPKNAPAKIHHPWMSGKKTK